MEEIYKIVIEAEITNHKGRAVYEAIAINVNDVPDEFNSVPAWSLIYEIPQDIDLDAFDPSVDIDWSCPDEVLPYGGEGNQGRFQFGSREII